MKGEHYEIPPARTCLRWRVRLAVGAIALVFTGFGVFFLARWVP